MGFLVIIIIIIIIIITIIIITELLVPYDCIFLIS